MIALAYKRLDEQVEAGLTLGAFAVFQCPLKEESEPALAMLKVRLSVLMQNTPWSVHLGVLKHQCV